MVQNEKKLKIFIHTCSLYLKTFILACATLTRLRSHDRRQPSYRRMTAVAYGGEGYKRRGAGAQKQWKPIGSR